MSLIELLNKNHIPYRTEVSGASVSYFGSGGIIKCLIEPKSVDELVIATKVLKSIPYSVIGGGCNILIADEGIDTALSLNKLKSLSIKGNTMDCYAGCRLQSISSLAKKCALSGAEFLTGIPGTFGGAVCMNAGAFGSEIKDIIKSITLLDKGKLKKYTPKELGMQYRNGMVGDRIVVCGEIGLLRSSIDNINALIRKYAEYRYNTQPQERSLGSVFKRFNGVSAAVYIERADLKGMTSGNAELSRKHCNFIINKGGAKSADYMDIVRKTQKVVSEYGISLELENVLLGYE